ncbi:GlxA family transcriptional regulator [Pseudoroseicyclus aestuarii]|uniref:AraC family transcriptional regulator with amidase-like domain n=1 Tax=Pseudoroseicyclus aestuarii TaxID=1795041 RepID=A0A318SMQ1_9RHOB|nr:helix-turn-helix domain-containing protein [Pseudoroseicyclus aestuarii]PYE81361.1 AraC family transcriptional regulator with amidase-like domain [Pseudoroseicyclus aestuarii]
MTPDAPTSISFAVFDGFSNMVLASAMEPLRAACAISGRPLFEWRVLTLGGAAVQSSSGLVLQADGALGDAAAADLLVVVAGYGARAQAAEPGLRFALQAAIRQAEIVAGLDMGPWLIAACGALDGRRATVHWQEVEAFAETFLEVEVVDESSAVDQGRWSAGSATSAMALILDLIRKAGGEVLAYDVSTLFVFDPAETRMPASGAVSAPLHRALRIMLRSIEEPLPLRQIAERAGVSPRTLERAFARELGVTAGRYYTTIRLSHAQNLAVETEIPLHLIAARCGFASAATLGRAFRAAYGQTLSEVRRAARG